MKIGRKVFTLLDAVSLCSCHTKRTMGAHGRAHPSAGMTPTFQNFTSADIIDYVLEKSVSCQKKDGHGHACPSFFGYDNDQDLKVCFLAMRVT